MSSWTWDSGLWMSSLDCFNIIVVTCTWNIHYFSMSVSTRAQDPGLSWSLLDYFSMVASTCTWETVFLTCFNIIVNTNPWDLGVMVVPLNNKR
jgi:hypothetical protein